MAHVPCIVGLQAVRDAAATNYRNSQTHPQADFHWFQERLERWIEKIDDGLYWLLGGAQPTPHAHLASRPVIGLFRCALKLTLVISRKMPIHTRISVAFADIVPATDFHTPLQFYGVQRQGFGPLLHTVSQQVGFSNFC